MPGIVYNKMMAPLVVCAFNRVDIFKLSIASLQKNYGAEETDLYIYVDGPRASHADDVKKVSQVLSFANSVTGFKSVTVHASSENKGLASSIIGAATETLNQYGRVIVVEDDLICSKSFLTYMNQMLSFFEKDSRVMQVSGYSSKITVPKRYHWDIYLSCRAHSWSWATWKDRWDTVDWAVMDYNELASDSAAIKSFNKYGSDLFGMLRGWKEGKNNSWFIRFNYSMFKQGRYSVCPIKSLVRNDGFGNEATHCSSYNRFKIEFEDDHYGEFDLPCNYDGIVPEKKLLKHSVRYWSIPYRVYGKIMTTILKIKNSI